MKDCTELKQITKVINQLTINDIGNSSQLCKRERTIKPFELQQQVLGTTHSLSDFKKVIAQDGSSFAVHDSLQDDFKGRQPDKLIVA